MARQYDKYYTILELQPGASPEKIKKARDRLAKKWHPDKPTPVGLSKEQQKEKFQEIQEAFEILTRKNNSSGPDKTTPEPCDYCDKDCNLCGGFYGKWKEWKDKEEDKTHTYRFCSKSCYDSFFVCWECGRKRKKGENVGKGSGWLLKDYLMGRGGSFCSATCQQKFINLKSCHFCHQQCQHEVTFKDNPAMVFCSEKCARSWEKEVWNKKNLAKQRADFIAQILETLEGWNLLTEEEKQNFIKQVNSSQPKQFNNIFQQAKKLISEKQKLIENQTGGERRNRKNNSSDNDNSNDNPKPNSNNNSDNIPNQEGENNNNLPQNIKQIANLPLPQAQEAAEQEIEKLLKDHGISYQELDTKDLSGESNNWKDYLRTLDTPQKVADFTYQMQQAILKKALSKKEAAATENKKPKNGLVIPIVISVLLLLVLSTLIIVVRKRRRQRGF